LLSDAHKKTVQEKDTLCCVKLKEVNERNNDDTVPEDPVEEVETM
jgi:hypothetical protein